MVATIEGIALSPTRDVGGTDWTADALRDAADSLEGVPIVEQFGPDPDTVGIVIESEYRDGQGVWYRAKLEDDTVLQRDVAIAPAVTFGAPVVEDEGNMGVEGIQFESMAPVDEATEAVGEHHVVEDDGSE